MATFLNGVQDQVRGIRPPDDNLKFDSQLLQTRQSAYNKSHTALSKMYGTILNAGLTRDDNIMAREEFFKLIETDLHKIAGMDLSLEKNTAQAGNVFKQIYSNKALAKDMVWTKNFQQELQRAEGFRNCMNPEECGGQYWEDGLKYMQYKREEFKNATRDESLAFGNVKYVPYQNVMEKALNILDKYGFEMKTPSFSEDGRYMITTKNGKQAVKPMTAMFNKLLGENPQLTEMFKVKAYNTRKDWTYNAVASGQFNSLEEAAVGYVEMHKDRLEERFSQITNGVKQDVDSLKELLLGYEEDLKKGKAVNEQEYLETQQMYQSAVELQGYTDMVKNAQKNMHSQQSMNNIGNYLDGVMAQTMLYDEIEETAKIAAFKDYEVSMEVDKFALEEVRFQHDVALENIRAKNDERIARIKASADRATLKSTEFTAINAYNNAKSKLDTYDILGEAFLNAQSEGVEWSGEKPATYDDAIKMLEGEDLSTFKLEYEKAELAHQELKRKVNEEAIQAMVYNFNIGDGDFKPQMITDTNSLTNEQVNSMMSIYENASGLSGEGIDWLGQTLIQLDQERNLSGSTQADVLPMVNAPAVASNGSFGFPRTNYFANTVLANIYNYDRPLAGAGQVNYSNAPK